MDQFFLFYLYSSSLSVLVVKHLVPVALDFICKRPMTCRTMHHHLNTGGSRIAYVQLAESARAARNNGSYQWIRRSVLIIHRSSWANDKAWSILKGQAKCAGMGFETMPRVLWQQSAAKIFKSIFDAWDTDKAPNHSCMIRIAVDGTLTRH